MSPKPSGGLDLVKGYLFTFIGRGGDQAPLSPARQLGARLRSVGSLRIECGLFFALRDAIEASGNSPDNNWHKAVSENTRTPILAKAIRSHTKLLPTMTESELRQYTRRVQVEGELKAMSGW